MESIEEVRIERQLDAHRVDVEPASEAAHRDLERVRPTVGAQRDRLAVEDQPLGGKRAHQLDHLGHRPGDVAQAARVDRDLGAILVHLDARAVELELERRLAELLHPLGQVVAGRGQHRLERPEQAHAEPVEPGLAFLERRARDFAGRSRDHDGVPHPPLGQAGGRDDPLLHHSFESALTELAAEQSDEEGALFARWRERAARPAPGCEPPASRRRRSSAVVRTRRRLRPARATAPPRRRRHPTRRAGASAQPTPMRPCGSTPER